MYHALLRSSEVCEAKNTNHTLQHNQITVRKSGKGATLKITLGSYKHSTAQPAPLIVSPTQDGYCPVKAFQRYLKRRGGSKGPIFRHQEGSPISRSRLASVLKYHLTLTGRNASHYNTHLFRQGRATDMAKKGYTETQIASAGRWKSKVPQVYVKPDTVHCALWVTLEFPAPLLLAATPCLWRFQAKSNSAGPLIWESQWCCGARLLGPSCLIYYSILFEVVGYWPSHLKLLSYNLQG